ncbi:MAG: hypothetical protein K6E22_11440 [Treponema sp.]|nr:hypothetical protein [Treponema sp.]
MPALRLIGFYLIPFCFLVKFVGIPLAHSIVNIVKLAGLKKQVLKFGKEILPLERETNIKKSFIFIYVIFAVLMLVFGTVEKIYIVLLGPIVFLMMISELVVVRKFTKFNGIYENGIVFGSFLEWKDVFSWKKIDDNKISILMQNGLRFDLETKENTNPAIEYFTQKGIPEENIV